MCECERACVCEAISRHPCLSSDPCPLHLTGCGQCRPCSQVLSISGVWSKGDPKAPDGLSGEVWPSVSPQGEVVCRRVGWLRGGPSLDDREESGAQALSRHRSHAATLVRQTGGRQSVGWGGRGACWGHLFGLSFWCTSAPAVPSPTLGGSPS